ncbi:hypothetical protein OKW50_008304 [Paraburkholderia youngii]|uniref:hypothetical protein n=1 Tax=Paraburkholderia youngii TaxID=2782701 RepID=UPI003D21B92F
MVQSVQQRMPVATDICRLPDCLAATLAQPAPVAGSGDSPELGRQLARVRAVLAGETRVRCFQTRGRTTIVSGSCEDAERGGLF